MMIVDCFLEVTVQSIEADYDYFYSRSWNFKVQRVQDVTSRWQMEDAW